MIKINDPREKQRFIVLNVVLVIIFIILPIGSYVFFGLDFALGTLLGCFVVAFNFYISQGLIGKLLIEGKVSFWLLGLYLVKFGVTVILLYYAVVEFQINTKGILLGLSSVVFSSFISSLLRQKEKNHLQD